MSDRRLPRFRNSGPESSNFKPVVLKTEPGELPVVNLTSEEHSTMVRYRGGGGTHVALGKKEIPISRAEEMADLGFSLLRAGASPSVAATVKSQLVELKEVQS